MMLDFIAPDRARLDPDALKLYETDFDSKSAKIGEFSITGASVYWDPSSGRKKSDGSVCVLIYRDDKNRHIFIHDVLYLVVPDEELHPLARQCDIVLDFIIRHGFRRICIETNGIGNALPEIMRTVASARNLTINIQNVTNNKNKENRILDAIEPVLSSGRLHAHRRVQSTPLIAEMLGWTPTSHSIHDDGLDAVAGAISCTAMPIHPTGRKIQTFSANTDFKI